METCIVCEQEVENLAKHASEEHGGGELAGPVDRAA